MTIKRAFFIFGVFLFLEGCFSQKTVQTVKTEPEISEVQPAKITSSVLSAKKSEDKHKSLAILTRYFAQADGLHKEAWWVLTSEKKPVGKSPFGKVERALMASANIKLSNKSLFRCDRYLVKREILSPSGYPQKADIYEKCSEKIEPKKIAHLQMSEENKVQVTFYPENLEEVLGLGPTILNKPIDCVLQGHEGLTLISLNCKNWSQDRSKEHMIRLDTYEYEKEGKNLIKLRGKIFENLTEIRKVEADVPLEGKILVTETELFAPQETPTPTPTPAKKKKQPEVSTSGSAESGVPTPSPAIDPDLLRSRGASQSTAPQPEGVQNPVDGKAIEGSPADQGWPTDEQGNPVPGPMGAPAPNPGQPLLSPDQLQPIHETTPDDLVAPVPVNPNQQNQINQGEPRGR